MKKKLYVFALALLTTGGLNAQLTYNIPFSLTSGLTQTSGDICSPPWTVEEAKQSSTGNTWGCSWVSTQSGQPTFVQVQVWFTISDSTVTSYPTTLNGVANNNVDPGPPVDCGTGTMVNWVLDPTNYIPMGTNTFEVNYAASGIINQLNNLPFPGDPYMRVVVNYPATGIEELTDANKELIKITDLMGREIEFKPNTTLLYWYEDGSIERKNTLK